MPHDIEKLHRQASTYCIQSEFEAALDLWRQMLELEPGDERAIEGIRQCEKLLAAKSSAPAALSPEAIEDLDIAIDDALFGAEVTPAATVEAREHAGAAGPTSGSIDLEATQELRRRVELLLEEARDQFGLGNVDEAESILVRVLILDEENQAALKLQQEAQESRQATGQAPDAPPTSASTSDIEFDLSDQEESEGQEILSLGTLSPVEPSAEALPVDDQEPEPPAVDESHADSAAPDFERGSEEQAIATDTASDAPKSKTALPAWATDRRALLGAGGVLVLLAVVFGLGLFGGEDSPVVEPIEVTKVEKPVEAGDKRPEAAEEPPEPVVRKDPDQLLQEAQAGVEAEDWAAAVVAYNELLEQVPDHAEALENLPVAMERYRQQRDHRKKWNEAVSAFESGNFREALRHFYHVEGEMDVARLNRCKVNGWYNLGVAALRGNRCSTALDHFDEALVIRAGDEGVVAAMGLADACLDAGSPGAEVRGLEFRALED